MWLLSNIIMSGIRLLERFCVAIGPLLVGAVEFLIVFFLVLISWWCFDFHARSYFMGRKARNF